jgi:CHAP domain.
MQDFINQWLGKRVDYDHVYGYQCVDLIKQYLYQRFGLSAGAWGNAKDYWLNTNAAILTRFDKLDTTTVRAGDILPLKGLAGNPYGHIGIATGAQSVDTVEILEQNGATGNGKGEGGDCIRKRFVPKSRMYGVLRPKDVFPQDTGQHIGKTFYMKPSVEEWSVYDVGTPLPVDRKNRIGVVRPKKYGGLSYKILGNPAPNTYMFYSPAYGKNVLAYADGDAEIR